MGVRTQKRTATEPLHGVLGDSMGEYGHQRDIRSSLTIARNKPSRSVSCRAPIVDKWFTTCELRVGGARKYWRFGVDCLTPRLSTGIGRSSADRIDQAACKPGSVHRLATDGRPFLWDAPRGTPRATNPDGARRRACFLRNARPYSVLLQAGLALPSLLPGTRWALTPPFHPYPGQARGGLLSVALSLGPSPCG
jgi:hypothetical protein